MSTPRIYKGRYDLTLYDEKLPINLLALKALLKQECDFDYWLQAAPYGEQMFVGAMLYFYKEECLKLQKNLQRKNAEADKI